MDASYQTSMMNGQSRALYQPTIVIAAMFEQLSNMLV